MAGDSERCRSLKEALFEALAAVLSNEHGVRAAGEEQMKTLEVTEGNFISLAACVCVQCSFNFWAPKQRHQMWCWNDNCSFDQSAKGEKLSVSKLINFPRRFIHIRKVKTPLHQSTPLSQTVEAKQLKHLLPNSAENCAEFGKRCFSCLASTVWDRGVNWWRGVFTFLSTSPYLPSPPLPFLSYPFPLLPLPSH